MQILSKFKEMSMIKKILCVVLIVVAASAVVSGGNGETKNESKNKETKEVS